MLNQFFLAISLIIITEYFLKIIESDFSSVGRAFDCRGYMEIKGSLVQIREVGFFFSQKMMILNFVKKEI